jgi:DNA-binding MarR family transcriptional regulator
MSHQRARGAAGIPAMTGGEEVNDGNLSRHLRTLEGAGHVEIRKGYQGKRPRTWVHLTPTGARALDQEVTALRELVRRLDRGTGAPGPAKA